MRVDAQSRNIFLIASAFGFQAGFAENARSPHDLPPECVFEVLNCQHRRRIDELLVKLRIALAGRQAIIGQDVGVIKVHWRIKRTVGADRRIEVHYLDILSDWTRAERLGGRFLRIGGKLFPTDFVHDIVDLGRVCRD